MSSRKYFENQTFSNNSLVDLESKEGSEFESFEYLEELDEQRKRFIPNVDFSKPENFAKYGLAEKYYQDAIDRIVNNFPYDGSKKELVEWYNSSTYFDLYVYENEYPRTNGYAIMSADGWGTQSSTDSGYGLPSTLEYISIKGGPNPTNNGSFSGANIYDPDENRNSNLATNISTNGVSIEFWLNKEQFHTSLTEREVIFDLWNNEATSSTSYGRLRLELNTSSAGNFASSKAFRAIVQSGSNRQEALLGDYTTTASFTSQGWKHFAFAIDTNGITLYKNGVLDSTASFGTSMGDIKGTNNAYIGALITAPSGTAASAGAGKLSGSLDEFRFWKEARTQKEIINNWYTNVYGGTNTDDANTELGIYYKFNEGITGTSSIDAVVLDYSGRISNGVWAGYTSSSRNTGSAIVIAGAAEKELEDPILRTDNVLVSDYQTTALFKGKKHDLNNSSNFYFSFPDWIVDDDEENGGKLKELAQTLSSFFDTLHLQIGAIRELKDKEYTRQTTNLDDKPFPFAESLLTEKGMFAPDLFIERSVLEDLTQKTEGYELESDLFDLKNLIYQNIYNNLNEIVKSKGTATAIRNALHTFGVGEELVKNRAYISNEKIALEDERRVEQKRMKFINLSTTGSHDAIIYQTASAATDLAFISSSVKKERLGIEAMVKLPQFNEDSQRYLLPKFLTSSLFGLHEIDATSAPYNTWQTTPSASLFVRSIKNAIVPELTYFEVSSSVAGVPTLTSSKFSDAYDNKEWYLSVNIMPEDAATVATGSASDYKIVFSGYNFVAGQEQNSFETSGTIARATAQAFVQTNQKVFAGATRTNFTGTLQEETDIKFAGLRVWLRDLSTEEQKAHALDFTNYGTLSSRNNLYSFDNNVRSTDLSHGDYIALDWLTDTVTGSDASGGVALYDRTSGSLERRSRGSYVNAIAGYHHPATAYGLPASSTDVVDIDFTPAYSVEEFDGYNPENLVQIKTEEKETFGINNGLAPIVNTIEKSAQAGVNEEMLKIFGSVRELASLFANPLDRYRKNYKGLTAVRERFFKNVSNDMDPEDFLEFYKWIDSGIQAILGQLIPAGANFNEDVFNVIESHVLERNKYQNKFPTMEMRQPDPTGGAGSINELLINYRLNSAPIPQVENSHSEWWNNSVVRTNSVISSGDADIDADREQIRAVKLSARNRLKTTPQRFSVDSIYNAKETREANYWDAAIKEFGPIVTVQGPGSLTASVSADYLLIREQKILAEKDSIDVIKPNQKVKKRFSVENSRESFNSYYIGKGELLAPFTMWSSSVDTGYNEVLSSSFVGNISINNLHEDNYARFANAPMQGPFTEGWVGGRQHRHIALNDGTDAQGTRPEAFYLLIGPSLPLSATLGIVKTSYTSNGTHDFDTPRAALFRDGIAKRPVNVSNIQYDTTSARYGNFRKNYEVVQTTGRTTNNLWFHDNTGSVLSQTEVWTLNRDPSSPFLDATLPTRDTQKSVIVNRFSAPGGPEVMSRGYLEATGEEMSPYNAIPFRNLKALNSNGLGNNDFTGSTGPRVNPYVLDEPATFNVGYRQWLRIHSKAFGLFSGLNALNYDGLASRYKVNRNPISQSNGIVFDNAYVSHQIPRAPSGYSWVRASLSGSKGSGSFAFDRTTSVISGASSMPVPFADVLSIGESLGTTYSYTGLAESAFPSVITAFSFANLIDQGSTEIENELTFRTDSPSYPLFTAYYNYIQNSFYGHNSFSQLRTSLSKQARSLKEANKLSFRFGKRLGDEEGTSDWTVRNIHMAPAVYSKPLTHNVIKDGKNIEFTYSYANELEYLPFGSRRLEAATDTGETRRKKKTAYSFISGLYTNAPEHGITADFDRLVYRQKIWPKAENTFRRENRQRTQFTIDWWSSSRTSRSRTNVTNSLGNGVLTQSIWPLDGALNSEDIENIFSPYSISPPPTNSYQYKSILGAGELQNNCMLNYAVVGQNNTSSLGQDPAANNLISDIIMEAKIKPSALYARDSIIDSPDSVLFSVTGSGLPSSYVIGAQAIGGTPWSAPNEAGKEPFFYENYDAYISEMKAAGKEYSIIPEFRISEAITQIIDSESGEDTILSTTLSLTGASIPDDSQNSFYKEVANSDVVKYFSFIKDKQGAPQGNIKLSCKALKKFLPYEGFYPAQRVTQIASLFSASYADIITITGSGHPMDSGSIGVNAGGSFRTAVIPFFGPGILCNSIKSGVALEYPVFSASFDPLVHVTGTYISSSANANGVYDQYGARISASFDARLPFEALTDPLSSITTFVDAEPGENSILNSSITFNSGTAGDNRYRYAINNFLAETMNLFLENGSVTPIISQGEDNFVFISGNVYSMDIRLFEENMSMYEGAKSFGPPVDHLGQYDTTASFLPYLPPYDVKSLGREEGVRLIFTASSDTHTVEEIISQATREYFLDTAYPGTSFAVSNRTKIDGTIDFERKIEVPGGGPDTPSNALVIQPRWESPILDFSHRSPAVSMINTKASSQFSLDFSKIAIGDILYVSDGNIEVAFTAAAADNDFQGEFATGSDIGEFLTNLTDLYNAGNGGAFLAGSTLYKNFSITTNDLGGNLGVVKWTARKPGAMPNLAIRLKSPGGGIYSPITSQGTGFYDESSVKDNFYTGMWHQYGRIPTGSQGVKLQVRHDVSSGTESLAEVMGISDAPVKLGTLNDTTVKEAIVAVPFIRATDDDAGRGGTAKRFFEIDRTAFLQAKAFVNGQRTERPEISEEYITLAERMKNFVFPPNMDFFTRRSVNPFAMFIFEFGLELDKNDLADIWQNLPPTSTKRKNQINSRFELENADFQISYGLEDSWFAEGGLPKNTRWMIFKVKQRASYDYFEKLRESSTGIGYDNKVKAKGGFENPDYSYNWPYDFFSFVELAKIDTEISIDPDALTSPDTGEVIESDRADEVPPSSTPDPESVTERLREPTPEDVNASARRRNTSRGTRGGSSGPLPL